MKPEQAARVSLALVAAAILCFVLAWEQGGRPIEIYYVEGMASSTVPVEGAVKGAQSPKPAPASSVDINTAGEEELCALPGVGPAMAKRILAYREEHGGFYDIEELLQVPGIGEKTLERLAPYATARPWQ